MKTTIKKILDEHTKIKPDINFSKKIRTFRLRWLHKSPEYIQFLSSNLTGVYLIVFSANDDKKLTDVLDINPRYIEREARNDPDIDMKNHVAPNPLYMSLLYSAHLITNSNYLSDKRKEEVITDLFHIMAYKMIGSMFSRFFSLHSVDINVAKIVYERLSYSYLIKKPHIANWGGLIDHAAKSVLPGGIHYERIKKFDTLGYVNAVNGIQGSFKSVLKYIYRITDAVDKENKVARSKGLSTTSVIETLEDGNSNIKDLNTNGNLLLTKIRDSFSRADDFIDDDLIKVACSVNSKIATDDLRTTLKYLTTNDADKMSELLKPVIEGSIEYLRTKNIIEPRKNIVDTLTVLKGYWRGTSDSRKNVKAFISKASKRATGRKTSWFVNALTICVIIYIFLKAIV